MSLTTYYEAKPHPREKLLVKYTGNRGSIFSNGMMIANFEFDNDGNITKIIHTDPESLLKALDSMLCKFGNRIQSE